MRARDLYADAPAPPPGHLDLTGARARLGASGRASAQVGAAYREVEEALAKGLAPSWNGRRVNAAPCLAGGRKSVWVHAGDVDALGRSLLLAPHIRDAGPDDLRLAEAEAALGLRSHPAVKRAFAAMTADWVSDGAVRREGRDVGFGLVRPASGTPALALSRADLPVLEREVARLRPAPAAPGRRGSRRRSGASCRAAGRPRATRRNGA